MEQFGVSRPTIREAFRILETERLIAVRPGSRGGALVVAPDLTAAARYVGLLLQLQGATIDDVYEARKVAEPVCASMLARCRTKQDIADLAAVIAEIESAIEDRDGQAPDPARWSRLTHRFHELIMQRSGNKTLALQGAMLRNIVATHTELRVSRHFDRDRVSGTLPASGQVLQEAARADRGARRRRRGAAVARPHGIGGGVPAQGRSAGQAGGGAVRLSPVGPRSSRPGRGRTGPGCTRPGRRGRLRRQHPQLAPGDAPRPAVLAQPVAEQHLGPVDEAGLVLHRPPDPPVAGGPDPLAVLARRRGW